MDRQATKEGKERVRVHLLVPLQDVMRFRRPRKVSEGAHLAGLAEVQARLAAWSEEDLIALRELVVASAKSDGEWPAPAVVLGWANAIRRGEPSDSRMVRSYLASAAGRRALASGCHIELWRWLKQRRFPKGDADWRALATEAEARARRQQILAELVARGVALSAAERAEVEAAHALDLRVRAMIPEVSIGEDAA